jgi:hypothetical protein
MCMLGARGAEGGHWKYLAVAFPDWTVLFLLHTHDHTLPPMLCRMLAENQALKQDNARLAHVIDSGDWGRERVAELLQAGKLIM